MYSMFVQRQELTYLHNRQPVIHVYVQFMCIADITVYVNSTNIKSPVCTIQYTACTVIQPNRQ